MSSQSVNLASPAPSGEQDLHPYGQDLHYLTADWTAEKSDKTVEAGIIGRSLFTTDYDYIDILLSENIDPPRYSMVDALWTQEALEPNLLENGDRSNFETFVEGLVNDPNRHSSEIDKLPKSAYTQIERTDFRIFTAAPEEHPLTTVPLNWYVGRSRHLGELPRPRNGEEIKRYEVYENIRDEDIAPLKHVIRNLKDIGGSVYLTGSVAKPDLNRDYDDIDIVVDAHGSSPGLDLHDSWWLEKRLRNITGEEIEDLFYESDSMNGAPGNWVPNGNIDLPDDEETSSPFQETWAPRKYGKLGLRYKFSLEWSETKTSFDIGFFAAPFRNSQYDDISDPIFAKV